MTGKGIIDHFSAFLIGGLVLLISLAALFSAVNLQEKKEIPSSSGKERFIPYMFSFDVSKLKEITKFSIGDKDLSNGFLFGEEKTFYSLNGKDLLDVKINFNVSGSNFYMPVIIKVNGNEIVRRPLFDGVYSFSVNNVSTETLIELSTESSSWRLWAPSIYHLKDVNFEVGKFSQEDMVYRFNVTKIDKIKRGNIDFTFQKNTGIFSLTFNNYTIHNDAVNDIKTIELRKEQFVEGINKLTLSAEDNSAFKGSAVMAIVSGE
jgi:hypothetical protein